MKISQRGLDLIKKYEGFYSDAYICEGGKWTYGYGSTIKANGLPVKKGDAISQSDAQLLLEKQVNEHSSTIPSCINIPLNQNQFDALACFQYNLGKHILSKNKALANYINNQDWINAIRVMNLYNKANGKVLQGLVKRRKEETELFMTPTNINGGNNMNYTYKKIHVSSAKYKIKCPYSMKAEYITVHNTANDASAQNEVSYHNRNNNQVSYHIAIDDKEAIEVIPLNRNAWHCGDGKGNGNMKSIGIEICYSKSGGARYEKAEENAVHLVAKMLHERGWKIDRVRTHQSWSKKYCPHRILDKTNGWNSFLKRVQTQLDILNGKINNPPPSSTLSSNNKEERVIKLLKDATSATLRNEFVRELEQAYKDGVFTDKKWIEQAKSGEMTLADAFLLNNRINKGK